MRISTIPALAPLIFISACGSGDNRGGGNASEQKQAAADVLPKAGQWEVTGQVISIDGQGITDAQKKGYLSARPKPEPQKLCVTEQEAKSTSWLLGANSSCRPKITMKDGKISGSVSCTGIKAEITLLGSYGGDNFSIDSTGDHPSPFGDGNATTVTRITGKRIAESCTSKN